jgi:hypothetical protein
MVFSQNVLKYIVSLLISDKFSENIAMVYRLIKEKRIRQIRI